MLKAPFPWFGGKSKVAGIVWERFGQVKNYVEPFFGSGAVLLGRPQPFEGYETVNDKDGYVSNFWRSVQQDPETTAYWADQPINENDLHARHHWLLERKAELVQQLEGDPDYFDPKIAGWWVWGISSWIGSGWCEGKGPWRVQDGRLLKRPHLSGSQGINRKLPHFGGGKGVNRQQVRQGLLDYFLLLANRLNGVKVCSGDWSRVCGKSPTSMLGTTGVFLDPPYSVEERTGVYSTEDFSVAKEVAKWCQENGSNPKLRIALCGYAGEHDLPGWTAHQWKANGGYGNQGNTTGRENASKEVIWFSPACLGSAGPDGA